MKKTLSLFSKIVLFFSGFYALLLGVVLLILALKFLNISFISVLITLFGLISSYLGLSLLFGLLGMYSPRFELLRRYFNIPLVLFDRFSPYGKSIMYPFYSFLLLLTPLTLVFFLINFYIQVEEALYLYLSISTITICYTFFGNSLLRIIEFFHGPKQFWKANESASEEIKIFVAKENRLKVLPYKLAKKYFNQANFKSICYFFYFVSIVILSILTLSSRFISPESESYIQAFIYAFITFFAFDKVFLSKPNLNSD